MSSHLSPAPPEQAPAPAPLPSPSPALPERSSKRNSNRMSFSSMMGGLSRSSISLALARSRDDESPGGRGRSLSAKDKDKHKRASSLSTSAQPGTTPSQSSDSLASSLAATSRARSTSPWGLRRFRTPGARSRDASPDTIGAIAQSDVESDAEPVRVRPRNAFGGGGGGDGGGSTAGDETEDEWGDETEGESDSSEDDGDEFDPLTESNTEQNALIPAVPALLEGYGDGDAAAAAEALEAELADVDPLGEGVNVVIPPEPYFPTTLNSSGRNPRRRKTKPLHDPLPIVTARPRFMRDRCLITIRHGDPERALKENGRRGRRYVVASDLSEESRYAVEWGIGTVLRDGDEMLIVNINENESKVDPPVPNPAERTTKVRSQQERQALAYILVRQATSLLQRTNLNVTVLCQAWHAKNARHMLLDLVDYLEPTMLIVGSRGLGQLKGILLGSTSHYLIQKCSVPVMVARRRLKRPPKKSAHLAPHRARVSLAEAGIDRVASTVDQDVQHMREEVTQEEDRKAPVPEAPEEDDEGDEQDELDGMARKVPGDPIV